MWLISGNVTHVTGLKLAAGAFNRALHRNTPETGSSRSNRTNNDERQWNAKKTEKPNKQTGQIQLKDQPNIGDETMIGRKVSRPIRRWTYGQDQRYGSCRLPEEKSAKTTLTKPPLARVKVRTLESMLLRIRWINGDNTSPSRWFHTARKMKLSLSKRYERDKREKAFYFIFLFIMFRGQAIKCKIRKTHIWSKKNAYKT